MTQLKVKKYDEHHMFYRPDTTDENVIREVIDTHTYRKRSIGFDVEKEERWLDLGANIGSFAVYCKIRGATAVCYEPEPHCFNLLQKNATQFTCVNATVSHYRDKSLQLWSSSIKGNHYRGTLLEQKRMMQKVPNLVRNVYAGDIKDSFDGVKIDIEGSEFGLIDNNLLPRCQKLCMEYHTSRDKSMERLSKRIRKLKAIFEVVSYPSELEKLMKLGGEQKSFHDRVIYCMKRKQKPQPLLAGVLG